MRSLNLIFRDCHPPLMLGGGKRQGASRKNGTSQVLIHWEMFRKLEMTA